MNKFKLLTGILMTLAAAQLARAADPFTLTTVQGTVVSFEKEVLTIQPVDTKAKPVALHVTGTSRVSIAGTQSRIADSPREFKIISSTSLQTEPLTRLFS